MMDRELRILHLEDLPSDALFVKKALVKSMIDYQGLVVDTKAKFIAALTEFFLISFWLTTHCLLLIRLRQ